MGMLLLLCASLGPASDAAAVRPKAVRLSAQQRIDRILRTPIARNAQWGIHVVNLTTRRVVYERNAAARFLPASNAKLFSTALALERLGPGHRFMTRLAAGRSPNVEGVLEGDLLLIGGGDPTLSGRLYPYQKDAPPGNPMAPLEALAEELLERGVRVITGDVVGDDSLYPWSPYPEGWTIDDATWDYGAPVSALAFNDNAFTLVVRPGEGPAYPALVSTHPPLIPLLIDNRVATVASGQTHVHLHRAPGSRQLLLSGSIAAGDAAVRQLLAVDDPAYYAACALYDVLTRKGVRIYGEPAVRHRWTDAEPAPEPQIELARRHSPPLIEIARVINKVSQNLHAEILLREVARKRGLPATREAGLKELEAFLAEIGIPEQSCHFEDGSGLSRRTLVTPAAITTLLSYMDRRNYARQWESLLPVGGQDGTLAERFADAPAARKIHAKTGTLATASALAGYLTTRKGARLAFSIVANNHTVPSSEIRKIIDKIGIALLDWEGK